MQSTAIWKGAAILVLLGAMSVGAPVFASGTYASRPPRPPASVDRGLYELGKKVFTGEFVRASVPGTAASQGDLLRDLYERLPHKARAKSQLASYAGQLTAEQIDALLYFMKKRYRIR